jgi:catechol 2,3-dioxygenase-like lactoylglutathione lyase family enzyme
MATVNVRYMVEDVQAAVDFYTTHLGFRLLSSIELFQPVRR